EGAREARVGQTDLEVLDAAVGIRELAGQFRQAGSPGRARRVALEACEQRWIGEQPAEELRILARVRSEAARRRHTPKVVVIDASGNTDARSRERSGRSRDAVIERCSRPSAQRCCATP